MLPKNCITSASDTDAGSSCRSCVGIMLDHTLEAMAEPMLDPTLAQSPTREITRACESSNT